jgi:hypothetical protein
VTDASDYAEALRLFALACPDFADDLRAVVSYAEDVHSKDDPVCAPARRLMGILVPPKVSLVDADLPAPEGFVWVEVASYCDTNDAVGPQMKYENWHDLDMGTGAWSNGRDPHRGFTRGDHPLEPRRCAWERAYVLRPTPNDRSERS